MATTKRAISSPMCRILVNGTTEIGWGSGISVMESVTNVPVKVLGSVYTQQLCPVDVTVQVSISSVHIDGATLESLNIYAQKSSSEIVQFKDFTLELVDTLGAPKAIATIYGCKPSGRTLPLGRGGIIARDMRFDALKLEVHTEPTALTT